MLIDSMIPFCYRVNLQKHFYIRLQNEVYSHSALPLFLPETKLYWGRICELIQMLFLMHTLIPQHLSLMQCFFHCQIERRKYGMVPDYGINFCSFKVGIYIFIDTGKDHLNTRISKNFKSIPEIF